MTDFTTPEFEMMKRQKEAILRRQREAKDIQIDRLKRLLRIALADLTGVRAGRLTPEQLRIFLSDCAAGLGVDDGKASNTAMDGTDPPNQVMHGDSQGGAS